MTFRVAYDIRWPLGPPADRPGTPSQVIANTRVAAARSVASGLLIPVGHGGIMTARSATFGWVMGLALVTALAGGRADARREPAQAAPEARPGSPAAARAGRRVSPLDAASLKRALPNAHREAAVAALGSGRWKPTPGWLATTGKKYGRLLIVSDLHPSTGRDPLTNHLNPTEDFLPNEQEVDFRRFMETQWKGGALDGETRTLVLNGDVMEFMQTDRPGEGRGWSGAGGPYGPTNSAANVSIKTRAILKGHPLLVDTYAQHMIEGHRIVLAPGNHDRQLLHPGVLSTLKKGLTQAVADNLARKMATRADGKPTSSQRKLALRQAKPIVAAQFEFEPYVGLIGDVAFRHGHQNDAMNNFSTPMGSYYHPEGRDENIEGAPGDYVVQAIFNKVEKREPWGDNTSNKRAVLKSVIGAADGSLSRAGRAMRYILTREGVDRSPAGQAKLARQVAADVRRWVKQQGVVDKLNEIRPAGDPAYTEDDAVELFLSYESNSAKAGYARFDRNQGAASRLGQVVREIPALRKAPTKHDIEAAMSAILYQAGVGTVATGHDHQFRVESSIVEDPAAGTIRRAEILDSATWTDKVPDKVTRTTGMEAPSRRGVIEVRFDKTGSHSKLLDYDPVRGLRMANVLESEEEAKAQRGGQGSNY